MLISRRHIVVSACGAALMRAAQRLKIVVAGGHPGDPECGCGGTIARYSELGHEVVLLYLNRGEGFCGTHQLTECAAIRTSEAQKACQVLKARPVFAAQVDGQAVVDSARYEEFRRVLDAEKPDVLFAQWPIDKHRDHRALSQLMLDAWLNGGRKSAFYYYEVADDTQMFLPDEFVDISDTKVQALRREACYAHKSQNPDEWFPRQVEMTRFRGTQSGYVQAEGFLRHWQSGRAILP